VSSQTALVPELHGQADNIAPVGAQDGRDGRRVDSARHGYGDGLWFRHQASGVRLSGFNTTVSYQR
jgi:hypothetical protein